MPVWSATQKEEEEPDLAEVEVLVRSDRRRQRVEDARDVVKWDDSGPVAVGVGLDGPARAEVGRRETPYLVQIRRCGRRSPVMALAAISRSWRWVIEWGGVIVQRIVVGQHIFRGQNRLHPGHTNGSTVARSWM